jgi:HSP20 family protein
MHFRPFGDVERDLKGQPKLKDEREPLVDVTEEEKEIVVIIELPGITRDQIDLNTTENELTVKVDSEYRKYYKEIGLPAPVHAESAQARFKNGVLEVRLTKVKKDKPSGKKIDVE